MPMQLNDALEAKRFDMWAVNPDEIILKEELRGRRKPPTEQEVRSMAESILDHSQEQPILVRKITNNRLLCICGFTRTAAGRLIREGFKDSKGEHRHQPEFKLKVTTTDCNDQEALVKNIVENLHRKSCSVVDDAFNHRRLREECAYSDADITRLYRYTDETKVGRLRRILSMPSDIQDLLHDNKLPLQAASDVMDLPDEAKQEEAWKHLRSECAAKGKISGSAVRDMVRAAILADSEEEIEEKLDTTPRSNGAANDKSAKNGTAAVKYKPLTIANVRKFFDEQVEQHPDEAVQEFSKLALLWLGGRKSDRSMRNALDKLLDAERS